jgi:NADPH:quinone reductase-like Zn-dependent oxidoreductase
MRAIVYRQYGSPDVLEVMDIPQPIPNEHQLLVRVFVSAVNSADARTRSLDVAQPMRTFMRMIMGWRKPRRPVLGTVFSGVVVQTGASVDSFAVGEEVFGCTQGLAFGCHAQYVLVNADGPVCRKPKTASHEEAAALVFGGTTSLHFLGKLHPANYRNILVYGASGAVGSAAVQIAHNLGYAVTASASAGNKEMVLSLGAQKFVDYADDGLKYCGETFDVIFDAVGKLDRRQARELLAQKGVYLTVGGMDVAKETKEQVQQIASWYEEDKLRAVIDAIYPMELARIAHQHVDSGHKRGNVILMIDSGTTS